MNKIPIIHKKGPQTAEKYLGFGKYARINAPLCVGAKALYDGKSFYTHREWRFVTCKHCLRKRDKG